MRFAAGVGGQRREAIVFQPDEQHDHRDLDGDHHPQQCEEPALADVHPAEHGASGGGSLGGGGDRPAVVAVTSPTPAPRRWRRFGSAAMTSPMLTRRQTAGGQCARRTAT